MSCPIQIWDEAVLIEQDHSRTCVLLSSVLIVRESFNLKLKPDDAFAVGGNIRFMRDQHNGDAFLRTPWR